MNDSSIPSQMIDPNTKDAYLRYYPKESFTPYISKTRAWQEIARWVSKKVGPRDKILELGAGGCAFINDFPAKEKHIVELWEGVYKHADPGIKIHFKSCTDMSCFNENTFDLVMAGHLLEHLVIEDALKTIAEVRRVLKMGGVFVIVQPNFKYAYRTFYDSWTHRTPFTATGLLRILTVNEMEPKIVMPKFMPASGAKSKLNWVPSIAYRIYLALPFKPFAKQMLIIVEKKEGVEFYHR